MRHPGWRFGLLFALAALGGCDWAENGPVPAAPGDARRGATLIAQYGCGGCHEIPGVTGARGLVGPPLNNIGARTIIAGLLPNTPENLARWIATPQSLVPGNAMPNMEIKNDEARDIAAYLYRLR